MCQFQLCARTGVFKLLQLCLCPKWYIINQLCSFCPNLDSMTAVTHKVTLKTPILTTYGKSRQVITFQLQAESVTTSNSVMYCLLLVYTSLFSICSMHFNCCFNCHRNFKYTIIVFCFFVCFFCFCFCFCFFLYSKINRPFAGYRAFCIVVLTCEWTPSCPLPRTSQSTTFYNMNHF